MPLWHTVHQPRRLPVHRLDMYAPLRTPQCASADATRTGSRARRPRTAQCCAVLAQPTDAPAVMAAEARATCCVAAGSQTRCWRCSVTTACCTLPTSAACGRSGCRQGSSARRSARCPRRPGLQRLCGQADDCAARHGSGCTLQQATAQPARQPMRAYMCSALQDSALHARRQFGPNLWQQPLHLATQTRHTRHALQDWP